jgi:hypothetical protein
MKALSIKQPYAQLIVEGFKDIENRTFKTHYRGKIYIHASGKWHDRLKTNSLFTKGQWLDLVNKSSQRTNNLYRYLEQNVATMKLETYAIIGEVEIIDCVLHHPSVWSENVMSIDTGKPIWNWVLANPVLYDKPILNVKGKLSFWDIDKNEIIKNAYGRFYNPQLHHYSMSGYTDPNHYSEDELYEMLQEIEMEFGEHRCRPKLLANILK